VVNFIEMYINKYSNSWKRNLEILEAVSAPIKKQFEVDVYSLIQQEVDKTKAIIKDE
jgi:hypothetical protein